MKVLEKLMEPITGLTDNPIYVESLDKTKKYVLSFDQSINTGMSIFTTNGELTGIVYITKEPTENIYEYKVKLMSFLKEYIRKYQVDTVVYERVYDGVNFGTTKNLILLESLFEEMKYAYGFNYSVFPIVNTVWKATILDESLKQTSKEQKLQIREKVVSIYPFLRDVAQDIIDSVGIGLAYFKVVNDNVFKLIKLSKGEFNKRISLKYEVIECDEGERPDLIFYIRTRKDLYKIYEKKGVVGVEYDEAFDIFDYMRLALTRFDSLIVLFIFDNRKMGSICLRLNIPYKKGKYYIVLLYK